MEYLDRENNFDLIRLIAAMQVVVSHSYEHLILPSKIVGVFIKLTTYFPGVPIFFCVSGFLIFASFERVGQLSQYFKNRALRIFPGLWGAFIFTLLLMIAIGYLDWPHIASKQFMIWFIAQVTFFQFYTPEFLRNFGVGTPNGSLWTISIELSFYVFLPILFWLSNKIRLSKTYLMILLGIASLLFNYWYYQNYKSHNVEQSNFIKLLGLNLIPYLFYFLGGAIIYEKWHLIKKFYINKGLYWLVAYCIYCAIFSIWLEKFTPSYWPNVWGVISILLLVQATISLAYTNTKLSVKLLNHNDISYGLYLFHMPIINTLVFYGFGGKDISFIILIAVVCILSFLSWTFIEKPALRLKNRTIRRLFWD